MSGWRRVAEAVLLAGALAVAVFLRFDDLGGPSFWLDEILGQQLTTSAAAQPLWRWVAGFDPEHGPLYYATQLATRVFGDGEFAGRAAAAFFGVLTVLVVWLAARRFGAVAAAVSAILLAVSPLHVYYSREARPYALLMLLTAGVVWVLMAKLDRSFLVVAILLVAMLYTTAVAATVVASVLLVAVLSALTARTRETRRWFAAVAACALVVLPLFRVIYAARPAGDPGWPRFPEVDADFLTALVRTFSVTALGAEISGRAAVAMLVFALIGAIVMLRRDWREAIVPVGMTILPLGIALAALRLFDHFYAARYVLPALVGFVILAAVGIGFLTNLLGERAEAILAVAVAVVTAAQGWEQARTEPFRKLDWRSIATTVTRYARPGDLVLAAEQWTEVSLRYYLERQPRPPKLVQMPHVALADQIRRGGQSTWLVTAGFDDSAMRRWMCGYPTALAHPLENFRLHYASVTSDFLRERGTPAEQRALATALGAHGFTLRMDEEQFFGEGWGDPEGDFRWAIAKRATLTVPRWGSAARTIRVSVLPFHSPSLPPQVLRVSVNGKTVGAVTLPVRWSEQAFEAPAALWVNGWNSVDFAFLRAHVPTFLDPRSKDHRPLAAAFEWIAVDDAGMSSVEPPLPAYLPERMATLLGDWRHTVTRFDRARFDEARVRALLGRLGLDPHAVFPRLANGSLHLDDVAETAAYGQDCLDDATFLRHAFLVLLTRPPNEVEQRDLLARMHNGASRVTIAGRIVKSDDFRKQVEAP
ncbi:MAG TPA: glycosyltransferase family 39 protein [Thermoanaerobaculia bacterium]|nr:glycosyltransferase family 39 protein [Thermoanaerobaculia bacterium]